MKSAPVTNKINGVAYSKAWSVKLSGVSVTTSGSDKKHIERGQDLSITATLDSGAPGTSLPLDLLQALSKYFNIEIKKNVTLDGADLALIPCKFADEEDKDQTFTFTFGDDMTVEVPIAALVDDLKDETASFLLGNLIDPKNPPFDIKETCVLGVQSTSLYGDLPNGYALFGRNVLRNAYLVFDLENEQIGMAKAVLDTPESNIVELKAHQTDLSGGTSDDAEGEWR
jgi:hypothetical protein